MILFGQERIQLVCDIITCYTNLMNITVEDSQCQA